VAALAADRLGAKDGSFSEQLFQQMPARYPHPVPGSAKAGREVWAEALEVGVRKSADNGATRYKNVKSMLEHALDAQSITPEPNLPRSTAMTPLSETERWDFWEICEDRYQTRSTILTSQVPVANWHEQIGDVTVADEILDRLVHNAHRLEIKGESMRKVKAVKAERSDARRGCSLAERGKEAAPLFPAPLFPPLVHGVATLRGHQGFDFKPALLACEVLQS
jgi:IstB-like ATP binding protein